MQKCKWCQKKYISSAARVRGEKYCSPVCRQMAMKIQKRQARKKYNLTEKGKEAKRKANWRYWISEKGREYRREYEKNNLEKVREQKRKASKNYYDQHRREIAFRRSEQRRKKCLM